MLAADTSEVMPACSAQQGPAPMQVKLGNVSFIYVSLFPQFVPMHTNHEALGQAK